MKFPDNFMWGSATSSYQIEGAVNEDGRGPSIWDTFSHTPGKVINGDTGDVAADHYHRYVEDVAIMKNLGLHAYRFSIAWPRILPQGTGTVNAAGLDFYDRLVDELLAKNITPFATLYHWDLPQALEDKGGWRERMIIPAFVEYADVVTRRLGDRVKHWTTHNEPFVIGFVGNLFGEHAPGHKDGWKISLQILHHLFVSHGEATRTIRANVPDAQSGIVLNFAWADAASDSPEDQAARIRMEGFHNRWFLDPIFKGHYPQDMLELYGKDAPDIADGDMETISVPLDYLGINYYTRSVVKAGTEAPLYFDSVRGDRDHTDQDWEVYPDGLYKLLKWIDAEYKIPKIYITENGAAYNDVKDADGKVMDHNRKRYLHLHFAAAQRAAAEGVPLAGYFVWSLLDNFEWAWGYGKRFGIVYVDFDTGERTIKHSAEYLRSVIQSNSVEAL